MTSFVIVPLFALANAGIHLNGQLLGDAVTSPVTLGILFGYVVGKPLGVAGGGISWRFPLTVRMTTARSTGSTPWLVRERSTNAMVPPGPHDVPPNSEPVATTVSAAAGLALTAVLLGAGAIYERSGSSA